MTGILTIVPVDEEDEFKYNLYLDEIDKTYEIRVGTSLDVSYNSIISDPGDLDENILREMHFEHNPETLKLYEECRRNLLTLLADTEFVAFDYSIEETYDYIKRNSILKNKKIIIRNITDLDSNVVQKIKSIFGDDSSCVYFVMEENENVISFQEYCDTINAIENIVREVNRFNFSTIEKIMYVYDFVRNRVFVAENSDEEKYVSRDLSSALLGEKIVCIGYARIFKTILNRLGIECRKVYLKSLQDGEDGHVRNEIYIKDEKYGIDGVYYFDATWDSKRNTEDNSYLSSYRFFAKTKEAMDKYDKGRLVDEAFPYYSDDIVEIFAETSLNELSTDMVKSINHIGKVLLGKGFINRFGLPPFSLPSFKVDKDDVLKKLEPLVEYFDKPLSADILLSVLYNVRKMQYYCDPERYPFSLDDFYTIVVKSGWDFDVSSRESFIYLISTIEERKKMKGAQMLRYSESTGLEKNIEQVKLTKVLRLISDKKDK